MTDQELQEYVITDEERAEGYKIALAYKADGFPPVQPINANSSWMPIFYSPSLNQWEVKIKVGPLKDRSCILIFPNEHLIQYEQSIKNQ